MDTHNMLSIEQATGARWWGTVALLALPVQVALGALLLADASHGTQMLYAGLSSALLVTAGFALLRVRRRRSRWIAGC